MNLRRNSVEILETVLKCRQSVTGHIGPVPLWIEQHSHEIKSSLHIFKKQKHAFTTSRALQIFQRALVLQVSSGLLSVGPVVNCDPWTKVLFY